MKTIEDIEKLTDEQLSQIAEDSSVKVPESLAESLEALVGAAALTEEEPRRKPAFIPWAIAAAVAAVLGTGIFLNVPRRPKDTFSDPYLAYAEVQRSFDRISQKAASAAGKSVPAFEKTEELLNYISK
ncbi:MAG: hypothetical protein K6G39_08260 [Bacteroidales bacterium]|nr:hypothetical protein [Bacteroidales bacterium]